MKTLLTLLLLTLASILPAAEPAPAGHPTGRFYADSFLSLTTPDFTHGEDYAYGVGVGYQWTSVFATDLRVTHKELNFENNVVSTVGGRVIARLPWQFLSPYGFLGAQFDLGPDQWRLQPGLGAEIGVTKLMKGMSLFAEGGLDADLKGRNGYLFTGGVRIRF